MSLPTLTTTGGAEATPVPAPTSAEASSTEPPAALPSPFPTPSESANAETGTVTITLDAESVQTGELAIMDAQGGTLFTGTLEPGNWHQLSLPPGEYAYRLRMIFEPLEPTPCFASVAEGQFTLAAGEAQSLTAFLGPQPDCTP